MARLSCDLDICPSLEIAPVPSPIGDVYNNTEHSQLVLYLVINTSYFQLIVVNIISGVY